MIGVEAVRSWVNPPGYTRISYGDDPLQFGDLRLPAGSGPHPVAIMIHGGGWRSAYDITIFGKAAKGITDSGIATWSLEYRRVGNKGGGWPGTFQDIANGSDYLRELAHEYPLDLNRVIVIGHSAGGHLALWVGGRNKLNGDPELASENPIALLGVLGLAPVPDLAFRYYDGMCDSPGDCRNTVKELMGGSPQEFPERYKRASPVELVPLGVRQTVIYGGRDYEWTREHYYHVAKAAGDPIRMIVAPQSGHFELTDPDSPHVWNEVVASAHELLGIPTDSVINREQTEDAQQVH